MRQGGSKVHLYNAWMCLETKLRGFVLQGRIAKYWKSAPAIYCGAYAKTNTKASNIPNNASTHAF